MRLSTKINAFVHELFRRRVMWKYRKEIATAKRQHPELFCGVSKKMMQKHLDLWRRFDKNLTGEWMQLLTAIRGVEDPYIVPSTVYYGVIERCLNNCNASSTGIEDKNLMSLYVNKNDRAYSVVRYNQGCFFDDDFNPLSYEEADRYISNFKGDLIGKIANGSSGGHSITLYRDNKDGCKMSKNYKLTSEWIRRHTLSYIVQERLKQEPTISAINPGSINTMRMMTYRRPWDGVVQLGASMIRFGYGDSIVDNISSGGMSVGVDSEGVLNNFGVDCTYGRVSSHPQNGFSFGGLKVPFYSDMRSKVLEIAARVPDFNVLGFDVIARPNGHPCIIEINATSLCAIEVQMSSSIFGSDTEKMIEWCAENARYDKFAHLRTWY